MGSLLGVSWLQWSAGAIVVLAVVMVLTGRLVPSRAVKELRKDRDERVAEVRAEVQVWRDAYMTLLKTQDVTVHYLGQLTEVGSTMNALLKALPPPKPSSEDGHDAPSRT